MRTIAAALVALMSLAAAAVVAAPVREVSIWVARDAAPGPKVRLTVNTQNVPMVTMAAYRLQDVKLLIDRDRIRKRPEVAGKPVREWNVNLAAQDKPLAAQRDVYRSRQVNLPPLQPGVYLLIARGGGKERWAIVNITHLAVVVKRSPKRVLTWVSDATNDTLIKNANVTLYEKSGKSIKTGVTGQDGVCIFPASPGADQTVVVTRGRDLAAVPSPVTSRDGELKAHFQTDRPIYRPGQTVFFKAILRRADGRGYRPVANAACDVQVRDPKDYVLLEKKAATNAIGTLADQIELPSEGAAGPYTIVVNVGKESVYETFSVAEYRKPEFKVSVKPVEKRYLAGEEAAFEVQANYYFGAPLPQAEVGYQVRRANTPYGDYDETASWYRSSDGNLYARDTYGSSPFVAEGTVYTDESGKIRIPIKTDKNAPDSTYNIQCTVQDASRRQVEASGSVPVYAAALRLGISTDVIVTPLGSVVPVRLRAADLDGRPVPAKVTLTVKEPVWDEKEGRYRFKEIARTEVAVPASGTATAKVPAKAEGDLTVTAAAFDKTGRKTTAELSFWVAGPSGRVERADRGPALDVKLDRRTYEPGDTVKVWMTTNTTNRPVLLTVEGGDIWQHRVVPAGVKSFSWSVKTGVEMSPNAYIEAAQWTRSGILSASVLVPMPDRSRKLKVTVEPDRTAYKPGEQAVYVVRTSGSDGKPIPAEVAISVVDEAVYALRADSTSDLYTTFWGTRDNSVTTGYSAPEELSGGAYQRVSSMSPARQRFLDTAYWNARVVTGSDGIAKVSFELPGNLTTWRATARAVTADTRVGTTTASVQVSRPVMLRLAVPRQLVQGDRLTLIGTVNNRTDQPHEFETAISAEGIRVEGETTKRVQVPARGEATVEWLIAADSLPESGYAYVTGRTLAADSPADKGEEFSDALRMGVWIVPKGIQCRYTSGGAMAEEKTVVLSLPADRIEPASTVTVTVRTDLTQVVDDLARETLSGGRYGSLGAADHLLAAPLTGQGAGSKEVRESLAALSRCQLGSGAWGWWDNTPPDPVITAQVLTALARARAAGISAPQGLIDRGISGAVELYNETNLWEHRALLASALTFVEWKNSGKLLEEVRRRGTNLSPHAQLLMVEALAGSDQKQAAAATLEQVIENAVVGPETAYVPAGDHAAWSASAPETTAQALITLVRLSKDPELQSKLAQWLASPDDETWWSQHENAIAARALADYVQQHPQSTQPGGLEVVVNGTKVDYPVEKGGAPRVPVPRSLLKDGDNSFTLRRTGGGEAFYAIEARVYRPADQEAASGMRTLRRYEVQSVPGVWDEVRRAVKPSEPVRCTVLVWPDDRSEGLRIVEPIPAGFEFVDSDYSECCAREEVRDGAVIHYLQASGYPVFFRYYLRAESEGVVAALPASGEVLRRPAVRGNSPTAALDVKK